MPQRSVEVQLLYAIIKHRYEIPGLAKGRTQIKNLQIHFFFTKLFVIGIHRIPELHNQVTKNVSNASLMRYTLLTPTVHQAFSAQNMSQRNDQKEIWAAQLYINIMHGP